MWHRDNQLKVGHTIPDKGTLDEMYIATLKDLLNGAGTVFPTKPDQDFTLLVDIKSANNMDAVWKSLVDAVAPLRDGGWLSRWENGKFKKGKVTVVASGNAAKVFDKLNNDQSNPGRAIFFDAILHGDLSNKDQSNTYLASADWKDAVDGDINRLRSQVKVAHEKGFKVRYCKHPSSPKNCGLALISRRGRSRRGLVATAS